MLNRERMHSGYPSKEKGKGRGIRSVNNVCDVLYNLPFVSRIEIFPNNSEEDQDGVDLEVCMNGHFFDSVGFLNVQVK